MQTSAKGLPLLIHGQRNHRQFPFARAIATPLLGLSLIRSPEFAAPVMRLPILRDDCRPTSLLRLFPTQIPELVALLMALPSLRDDCGPTLLIGLFPTQIPEFVVPLMAFPYSEMTVDSLS